jgi:alkylation response protein AidB-like acyl-CoA dehydrogenase
MRFALTPEQEAFRDSTRRFLADRVRVRDQIEMPGAHDPVLWKQMAELGWLDELGFVETALLVEETGRALLPGPLLGTILARHALITCGSDEQRERVLPPLAHGERVVAPAITGGRSSVRLVRNRLRGEHRLVPCAAVADSLLVEAAMPSGGWLFGVPASECAIEPVESADLTRPAAHVRFEGSRSEEQLDPGGIAAFLDRARVLIAAEMVGGADAALSTAVAYAKERVQFDRPVGSFQAVKHKAADAWRALEAARLSTWYAAWAIETGAADAIVAAAIAKAAAGDAFVRCAADSIQIHGGIGFTWEHDAHLAYRRAIADQAWLGDSAEHRDRVAASVLAEA